MSGFDIFESLAPEPKANLAFEGEPHAKLKRNLAKALDLQDELMDGPRESVGDRMVLAGISGTVVKAALATDKTALKARSDKTIERVWLRLIFIKLQRGYDQPADRLKMLREAPRAELEAALGPMIKDYDKLGW